jgi:hypothetical protein
MLRWYGGGAEELRNAQKSLSHLQRMTCFGNYWWYAFNTNVCFKGYVNIATLTFVHTTKARQAVNRLLGKGCSYVPNFGHSEVLIKMTD